jgi:hypothetical protein
MQLVQRCNLRKLAADISDAEQATNSPAMKTDPSTFGQGNCQGPERCMVQAGIEKEYGV